MVTGSIGSGAVVRQSTHDGSTWLNKATYLMLVGGRASKRRGTGSYYPLEGMPTVTYLLHLTCFLEFPPLSSDTTGWDQTIST
jgi:hypothetical protein